MMSIIGDQRFFRFTIVWYFVVFPTVIQGQSHSSINQSRSGLENNVFVSQSIEGEYAKFDKKEKSASGEAAISIDRQTWRGYGVQNGVGIELFKFTQFSFSHTLLNLRSKESALENLNGSRIALALNFAFNAPIANIEFGVGATASQMAYQNQLSSSTLIGTGHYYSIGLNYFLSQSLSFFSVAKRGESILEQSGGSAEIDRINTEQESLGLGFKIWL